MAKKQIKPKTHSNILWHFTGGPKWDMKKNCQMKNLKNYAEALEIALKILGSKELRIGLCFSPLLVRIFSLMLVMRLVAILRVKIHAAIKF